MKPIPPRREQETCSCRIMKPIMTEEHQIDRRMALLIDGDNAQPSLVANILAEASKYGLVTIRRIYGDWTTPNMNSWRESLQVHAFQPIQQFRYTKGKNATDSAMIIDAMDILYETVVNAYCLVSSDSDYTRLATRIQGEGTVRHGNWTERYPAFLCQRLRGLCLHRQHIFREGRGIIFILR